MFVDVDVDFFSYHAHAGPHYNFMASCMWFQMSNPIVCGRLFFIWLHMNNYTCTVTVEEWMVRPPRGGVWKHTFSTVQ